MGYQSEAGLNAGRYDDIKYATSGIGYLRKPLICVGDLGPVGGTGTLTLSLPPAPPFETPTYTIPSSTVETKQPPGSSVRATIRPLWSPS